MIEIKINNENEVSALLEALSNGVRYRAPLMRTLANTMRSAVDQNFEAGGRPKWLGVNSRPNGSPLIDSGTLRNTIRATWDNDEALVGTNLAYAAIHQFGGEIHKKARKAKLYYKMNKNGEVSNRFVKKSKSNFVQSATISSHTITITARPFLVLTSQDEADILEDVQDYFQQLIK